MAAKLTGSELLMVRRNVLLGGSARALALQACRRFDRTSVSNIAGIDGCSRLEEQYVRLLRCHWLVLDATRNNEELALSEFDYSISQVNG